MNDSPWLQVQRGLYQSPPDNPVRLSTHPVSGQWQTSDYLKNQFWWGGGATQEGYQQLSGCDDPNLTQIGVLSFGPVQSFLGSGQRLRDWAVASWLCHYLAGVLIHEWESNGGKVLLPLHRTVPLVKWLQGDSVDERFWQPELPNIVTGLFPNQPAWLDHMKTTVVTQWGRLLEVLEQAAIRFDSQFLNGIGWRVIHSDHRYLWSVYTAGTTLDIDNIGNNLKTLYQSLESQKTSRSWQGNWWGGKTSPSAGCLSQWHPGLKPVELGGLWGLPDDTLTQWWEKAATDSHLAGLFSESDRLNSLEMVKRIASVPEIIEPTLAQLWGYRPPNCPWGKFPDRTAIAAAWIPTQGVVKAQKWNEEVESLNDLFYSERPSQQWGMPRIDCLGVNFAHPRVLERRNLTQEQLADWEDLRPAGWESTIEWTVGWRGDGDKMGEWLSGKQYAEKALSWGQWHLTPEIIQDYQLNIQPPAVPAIPRKLEIPHILDLSILFSYWNQLLYPLTEQHHDGKVIFAGGDDFLLLAPLTEVVSLTSDLHHLWIGNPTPLTNPLIPSVDGWVNYQDKIYPVPGKKMSFSLGVVIAQRRIPQSLWHRGLTESYKQAKKQGRDRLCVRVLFNSGQSLEWVCPWSLWHLLMTVEPQTTDKTELNVWEKLLSYLESTHFSSESSPTHVSSLLETLWASVGLSLSWRQIENLLITSGEPFAVNSVTGSWQWWQGWLSLRAFLARQARERSNWIKLVKNAP